MMLKKKKLLFVVPFLTWIQNYPVKKWLSWDITSGLIVETEKL